MEVFSNFNSKYIGALNPSNNTKTDYAISNPIKQQGEQEALKSQSQTDSNGLTKALAGLAVIGAGVVGAAIYFKTKKKLPTDALDAKNISSQATQAVSDFQKGVKKFFNPSGDCVENVKLQKGKALLEDGSGFSGVLKTANNKGQEILIEYKDGYMSKSAINGVTNKTYEAIESLSNEGVNKIIIPRDKGVFVTQFDEYKNIKTQSAHMFDDNGNLSRSYSRHNGSWAVASDFKDGKIAAKTEFGSNNIKQADVFDKNGNVVKMVKNEQFSDSKHSVIDILPDGSKKERVGMFDYDRITTPANEYGNKIRPDVVRNYSKDDKLINTLLLNNSNNGKELQFIQDDGTICVIIMPKGKIDNTNLVKFEYLLPDNTSYSAAINDSGKNIAINAKTSTKQELEFIQKKASEVLSKAKTEGMDFPYDKAEEYLSKIFNI